MTHDKKITISLDVDTALNTNLTLPNFFIRKVIDKGTKIKSKCCRGRGLNLCPLITRVFPVLKNLKSYHLNLSATVLHSETRVLKGMSFNTLR